MRKLILCAALALAGCATTGVKLSAAQTLYETVGLYDAALHGANAYAVQPGANKVVVHTANVAAQNVTGALTTARAFPICANGGTSYLGQPCASFDFSTAGILRTTIAIQTAIVSLEAR